MLTAQCFVLWAVMALTPGPDSLVAGPVVTAPTVLERARELAAFGEPARAYGLLRTDSPDWTPAWAKMDTRLLAEMHRYAEADSMLALHRPLDDDTDVFLHYLQRARLNQLAGRNDRALDMLAEIDSIQDATFDGYRELIRITALTALGRGGEAAQRATTALEADPPRAIVTPLREALAAALAQSGSMEEAARVYRSLGRHAHGSAERARLAYAEYELYAATGDRKRALQTARTLVSQYGRSPEARAAADEVLAVVKLAEFSDGMLLDLADHLLARREAGRAKPLLETLRHHVLSRDQQEALRILRAEYHYRIGDLDGAVALAKPAYRDPNRRRMSILLLARSYRAAGRETEAAGVYEYFAKVFPNDGKAAEALYVASRLYDKANDARGVERTQTRLRKSYPSSFYGRDATLAAARRMSDAGNDKAAVSVLNRLVKRTRHTDEGAMYLLAQIYDHAGGDDRRDYLLRSIRELNPYSFYTEPDVPRTYRRPTVSSTGQVALDGETGLFAFLDRAESRRASAREQIAAIAPPDGHRSVGSHEACIERGKWLLDAGFRDWGERELEAARSECFDAPEALLELAYVYDRYAMPWRSVRLYQRARDRIHWRKRRELDNAFRWLLYPTPFAAQVVENAARYGMPPHLVLAMMREESRFDSGAVSRVGALGLMQLMPGTAERVARELEITAWREPDLLVPDINIAFGVWYANSLLEQSDGNVLRMLAAYNAGPGNARRWFDDNGEDPDDPDALVAEIDFRETRNYVVRIVESAKVYHALYFDPDGDVAPGSP